MLKELTLSNLKDRLRALSSFWGCESDGAIYDEYDEIHQHIQAIFDEHKETHKEVDYRYEKTDYYELYVFAFIDLDGKLSMLEVGFNVN